MPFLNHGILIILFFGLASTVHAQHEHGHTASDRDGETVLVNGLRIDPANPPGGSNVGRAMTFIGDAYVHVAYSRPFKRGRVIFGGLVGFGQVWPLGAHYATEIVLTKPLLVAGERLEAGVYSLLATPGAETWTLHFNSVLGMHMADLYDAAHDVLVVEAPVETLSETVEQHTIDFEDTEAGADLRVSWDQTRVRLSLTAAQK